MLKSRFVFLCAMLLLCEASAHLVLADEPAGITVGLSGASKEPTDREQRQAIDAAVREKLRKQVDIDVIETPFSDVIKDLARQLDATVILDPEGLEESGVTQDQLVNLKLNLRGDAVLKVLLEPLHLSHVVRDGLLMITSPEQEAKYLTLRVYDVRDLLAKSGTASKPLPFVPADPLKADSAKPATDSASDSQSPSDQLVSLVCDTIAPKTWTHRGGSATARVFAGTLVVRQNEATLEEIADLLEAIRQAAGDTPSKTK
jgi:hypothetical protein